MSLNYLNKQKKFFAKVINGPTVQPIYNNYISDEQCQVINGPTVQPIYNNYISVEPYIGWP